MKIDTQEIIEQFVDYLMPSLTPYESTLYLFFLRNSYIEDGSFEIRIGKRTIGGSLGSSRGQSTAFAHVTELVNGLKEKGCIRIGDTNRDGTLYVICLPIEIPLVKEKLTISPEQKEEDYFTEPEKRKVLHISLIFIKRLKSKDSLSSR